MNYTQDQFKNCQFDPFEWKVFEKYPRLHDLIPKAKKGEESVVDLLPPDQVLRYIIALYDPKSPLIKGEQNLLRRKEVAAEVAGFDIVGQLEELTALYECRNGAVVVFIQNYLRIHAKSMEWAMIQSFEQAFWEYQARLMQPIEKDAKDKDLMSAVGMKTKLSEDIKGLYENYQTAISKFYGEDKELIERSGKIRSFTPEQVGKLGKAQ